MKLRTFTLKNTTWLYDVLVMVGGTEQGAIELLCRRTGGTMQCKRTMSGAMFFNEEQKSHALWLNGAHPPTLAHEAFHSAAHALKVSQCWPLTKENEESFAYLIGWTVTEISQRMKRRRT